MSGSLRLHMSQAGLLGWVKEIRASSKRYLCYTKYSEDNGKKLLSICLSDGVGVWREKKTEDELVSVGKNSFVRWLQQKELGSSSFASDLNKIVSDLSKGLQSGPLELTKAGDGIMLTVLCDGKSIDFNLAEMSAAVCREESQSLLFSVWDNLETTKTKLAKAESREKSGALNYGGADGQAEKEHSRGTEAVASSRPKKIKGASLFNPNTKRRKAATGVVFDKGEK